MKSCHLLLFNVWIYEKLSQFQRNETATFPGNTQAFSNNQSQVFYHCIVAWLSVPKFAQHGWLGLSYKEKDKCFFSQKVLSL